jgi:hypothetical protein
MKDKILYQCARYSFYYIDKIKEFYRAHTMTVPRKIGKNLYEIDYMIRDKVHAVGRLKIDKDHKVHEVLKALPDMKEFPIVLGREEYSYALPYEEQDKDEDEYYA